VNRQPEIHARRGVGIWIEVMSPADYLALVGTRIQGDRLTVKHVAEPFRTRKPTFWRVQSRKVAETQVTMETWEPGNSET
jgi:hypothetical protein